MNVGEIARTTLMYTTLGASEQQNVLYWILTVADVPDNQVAIAVRDFVNNVWGLSWQEVASGDATLVSERTDIVNVDGTIDRTFGQTDVNRGGVVAGTVLAAATSGLLTASTPIPKVRGRKYVPAPSEGDLSSGLFDASYLANIALLLADYLSTIDVDGTSALVAGVLSRTLIQFVEFSGAGTTTNVPAYQRRRKPGVGI